MVFHWSLSDRKSPQVSRTLLSILAIFNNVVVWMVSTGPPTSMSYYYYYWYYYYYYYCIVDSAKISCEAALHRILSWNQINYICYKNVFDFWKYIVLDFYLYFHLKLLDLHQHTHTHMYVFIHTIFHNNMLLLLVLFYCQDINLNAEDKLI